MNRCPNCNAPERAVHLRDHLGEWECGSTWNRMTDTCLRNALRWTRKRLAKLEAAAEACGIERAAKAAEELDF